MRTLVAIGMLLLALAAVATPADARAVACTDLVSNTCPGFYCLDEDLDGRIEPTAGECTYRYCPGGCCTCPPPEWW